MTPFAEVIGDPIAQSKSPAIHRFWLEKLGLPCDYRALEVQGDGLAGYFATRRDEPGWRGCNVTMPHKQQVAPYLDTVSRPASRVGAVNTVYRQGSRLIGENTDGEGFLEPLRPFLDRPHLYRIVRLLGTGGAARAIAAALTEHGFTLVVAGRTEASARALLDAVAPHGAHHACALAHFAEPTNFDFDDREGLFDLVVNATPLGMVGQSPLAFDFSHAPPGSIVYDIVTAPVETLFVRRARESGFATIDGLSMLIGQAAAAFRLFYGVEAPRIHDEELRGMLAR
ncbi:shikimate dehydrogenase [Qipengyuania sediminis]|uniref:shikimate dehydrogenase n=1 Tax=Qipengyuania sediminis TaxID=1532023 RepID=UPI00105960A2|nr:shikimate dehydrogenase [Qipengyuania sediminis]